MKKTGRIGCLIPILIFLVIIIIILGFIILFLLFPTKFVSYNSEDLLDLKYDSRIVNNFPKKGVAQIIFTLSNEDLAVLTNEYLESNKSLPLKNSAFRCNDDDTIDITFTTENISFILKKTKIPDFVKGLFSVANQKRVYLKIKVRYLSNNKFDITVEDAFLETLAIPTDLFDTFTTSLCEELEEFLNNVEGFEFESLVINEKGINFVGTIKNIS